jgi:hypothetical protein
MARMITLQRFLEQRDVDAGLYLLGRMLGFPEHMSAAQRAKLAALKARLETTRKITSEDRTTIVSSYREVIG